MGFRNPILTAEDPTARAAAAAAQTAANNAQSSADAAQTAAGNAQSSADAAQSAADAAQAAALARNRVYGPQATAPPTPSGGFTKGDMWLKTLSTGVALYVFDGASTWKLQQYGPGTLAAGAVVAGTVAAGAIDGQTLTGVIVQTADSGPAVRLYEGKDGKGAAMGYLDFTDGVSGDSPARITGEAYSVGGGGMTLAGGTYAGKVAASITLQTDGIAPELDLDANGGRVMLGATTLLRVQSTGDVSQTSAGHALQIGADGGVVVKMDNNEVMCVDEGNGNALLSWGLNSGASVPTSTITAAGSVLNRAYVEARLVSGSVGVAVSSGASSGTATFNFGQTFPSTPNVFLTVEGSSADYLWVPIVTSVSTTACTIRVQWTDRASSAPASGTVTVRWLATCY